MLRALVLVLLLANAAVAAYTLGWLDSVLGVSAALGEREPQRVARQWQPQAVRVLPGSAARAALVAASAASQTAQRLNCLEAGPFTPTEIDAAEQALASLPPGSWGRSSETLAAEYGIFLGPFASRDALQKKTEELSRFKVGIEEVRLPGDTASGAVIGRFDSRAEADAALARFVARGVKTARVATLRPSATLHRLRVEGANPALAEQVMAFTSPVLGKGFAPCPPSATQARSQ